MTSRLLLAIVAMFGLIPAALLTGEHFSTGTACPPIGPLPACVLVFAGYGLIFYSAMAWGWKRHLAFLAGWLPVSILALLATVLEIANGPVCPRAFIFLPQCFLSLLLSILIGSLWVIGILRPQQALNIARSKR